MNNKDLLFKDCSNINNGKAPEGFNESNYVPYFQSYYYDVIVPDMIKEMSYKNIFNVPKLNKIVVSSSISTTKYGSDKSGMEKIIKNIYKSLYKMTGVIPTTTKASVSVAKFKLQKGSTIGCKVIVRKKYLYEFLERLVHIYLPNVKGFLGIPQSSVGKNTLNIGIKDVHIVPEVTSWLGLTHFGFTITICLISNSIDETVNILKRFGIPIKKEI